MELARCDNVGMEQTGPERLEEPQMECKDK